MPTGPCCRIGGDVGADHVELGAHPLDRDCQLAQGAVVAIGFGDDPYPVGQDRIAANARISAGQILRPV